MSIISNTLGGKDDVWSSAEGQESKVRKFDNGEYARED
jgi:hypothetical protein